MYKKEKITNKIFPVNLLNNQERYEIRSRNQSHAAQRIIGPTG